MRAGMHAVRIIALALAVLLAACTHEFVRPAPGAMTLGKSHYVDVVKLLGKPSFSNEDVTINGEHIRTLDYYAYRLPETALHDSPHRYLHCSFFNDVLVGVEYNSSYPEDATVFDPAKAHLLAIGKSRMEDAVAALGAPSGEIVYPLVKDKEGRGLVYWYAAYHNLSELRAGDMYLQDAHRLVVFLDAKGVVDDISYKGRGGKEQYPGHITSRLSAQQIPVSPIAY